MKILKNPTRDPAKRNGVPIAGNFHCSGTKSLASCRFVRKNFKPLTMKDKYGILFTVGSFSSLRCEVFGFMQVCQEKF